MFSYCIDLTHLLVQETQTELVDTKTRGVQAPEDRYIATHAIQGEDEQDSDVVVKVDDMQLLRFIRRASRVCEALLSELAADIIAKRAGGKSELSVSTESVTAPFLANRTVVGMGRCCVLLAD